MQVLHQAARQRFTRLQERLGDSLLTALTIVLAVLMFILAPLHAAGIIVTQGVGFTLAMLLIAGVFILSGSPIAVIAMIAAFALATTAGVLRLQQTSMLDVYLDATAWTILCLALVWVIARAVFAPGRVNYHRIMGAIEPRKIHPAS
jgi:hypothetical protein